MEDATELGFQHIPFPFLLLAGGLGVALAVSLFELVFGRGGRSQKQLKEGASRKDFLYPRGKMLLCNHCGKEVSGR